MVKATFPYTVVNNLDRYIRLRQAELMQQRGEKVTLQEIYKEVADYCGVKPYTISMIKSGNYNPSITLAFLIADYFKATVDDIFGIVPIEGDGDDSYSKETDPLCSE